MDGLDVVMVIAIILFARLGIRLVMNFNKFKNEDENKKDDKKYNRVSEYKPTGNLIYNTALLKKIENPNNNK